MDNNSNPLQLDLRELTKQAIAGQKIILRESLGDDIPLYYCDENDNYVYEYPDGRIEIIKKSK